MRNKVILPTLLCVSDAATVSLLPREGSSEWDGCETDGESTPLMEDGGVTWDELGRGATWDVPGDEVVADVHLVALVY